MFDTLTDCTDTCVPPQKISRASDTLELFIADPCQQTKEVGPCRAAMPRWFYNKQSQQCEGFIFGGCQGNGNNFLSQNECQLKCFGQDDEEGDDDVKQDQGEGGNVHTEGPAAKITASRRPARSWSGRPAGPPQAKKPRTCVSPGGCGRILCDACYSL